MSRKKQDTYKEVKEYKFPNAIVRVHIPDLTDDERARRIERIKKSMVALAKEEIDAERSA